jgi:hypothetical protein
MARRLKQGDTNQYVAGGCFSPLPAFSQIGCQLREVYELVAELCKHMERGPFFARERSFSSTDSSRKRLLKAGRLLVLQQLFLAGNRLQSLSGLPQLASLEVRRQSGQCFVRAFQLV